MTLLQDKIISDKYFKPNVKFTPAVRTEIRQEIRRIIRDKFGDLTNVIFGSYPTKIEMISSYLSINFEEQDLGQEISAELKRDTSGKFAFLALINNSKLNEHHKRFSKFHEVSHVLLNLFN